MTPRDLDARQPSIDRLAGRSESLATTIVEIVGLTALVTVSTVLFVADSAAGRLRNVGAAQDNSWRSE